LSLRRDNCYKAQKKYKAAIKHVQNDEQKQKCKKQRNKNIGEAGCEGVGAAAGAVALGAGLGSFIPVVGTAIGVTMGNIAGRILGRMLGRLFGRLFP